MAGWALLIAGKADQRSAPLEGEGNRFSSPFLSFSTKNVVIPPSSLLPAARSVFVVSAEVHPAEQFHFVIFNLKQKLLEMIM